MQENESGSESAPDAPAPGEKEEYPGPASEGLAATEKAPPIWKPSPGRIVHYTFPDDGSAPNNTRIVPAIIVCVHSETMLNLRLFADNPPSGLDWQTSVQHSSVAQGGAYWDWPPRV